MWTRLLLDRVITLDTGHILTSSVYLECNHRDYHVVQVSKQNAFSHESNRLIQHSYGLNTGGPGVMVTGWICVSFFTFFVGLSMAEIVSAIPTSGGPYFWAAMLAPKEHAAFFSWITGWFNFVGQVHFPSPLLLLPSSPTQTKVTPISNPTNPNFSPPQFAVTTGISFGLAGLISTTATVKNADYTPTAGKTLGIYIAVLASHGLLNSFGVHLLKYLNNSSIVLHSLGVASLAIAVVAAAPTHRSAQEVFQHFYDGTGVAAGVEGWSVRASPAYVAICGILLSQYTITGYVFFSPPTPFSKPGVKITC